MCVGEQGGRTRGPSWAAMVHEGRLLVQGHLAAVLDLRPACGFDPG